MTLDAIRRFIRSTERAINQGGSVDSSLRVLPAVTNWCLDKRHHASPEAFLACWLALELMETDPRLVQEGKHFKEELIAAAMLRCNPCTTAMGEMYWVWSGPDEQDWSRHGTNPEFGRMSDREVFLFGFRRNAHIVTPVLELIANQRLAGERFTKLRRARPIIQRIVRSGDARHIDNLELQDCLMSAHVRLQELVFDWRPISSSHSLNKGKAGEDLGYLMSFPVPAYLWRHGASHHNRMVKIAVETLGGTLELMEKGKVEFLGPLLKALQGWDSARLGPVLGMFMAKALSAPEQYRRLVKGLPLKLQTTDVRGKKGRKLMDFVPDKRVELRHWYAREGKELRERIKEFMAAHRSCAKKLSRLLKTEDITLYKIPFESRDLDMLPAELRNRYAKARNGLGEDRTSYIPQILKIRRPSLVTNAIWLYDNGMIDMNWDEDQIRHYIRYSYRV